MSEILKVCDFRNSNIRNMCNIFKSMIFIKDVNIFIKMMGSSVVGNGPLNLLIW